MAGALARGWHYFAAGADCVYPILAADPHDIRTLVERLDGPVNILSRDGVPALPDLATLGVARISFGPELHRAARSYTVRMLTAIKAGRYP